MIGEMTMEIKDQVRKLRESTGMNRKEFCAYFGIPYRTMTEWELGNRKLPDYVLRMMAYQVKMEKLNVYKGNGEAE
jgi:putative transcriptional regulator